MKEADLSVLRAVDPRLAVLITRMRERCPGILDELETCGRKESCWAWWIFPTEKEGMCEPPPKTAVSRDTAPLLLQYAPLEWRQVLMRILQLADSNAESGGIRRVLPSIDHDRVRYFAAFWQNVDDTADVDAEWMRQLALAFSKAFDSPKKNVSLLHKSSALTAASSHSDCED